MSDSGGAAGASATFTASSNPTKGLQNYDLQKPALNLYPGPDVSAGRTKRLAALLSAARRKPARAQNHHNLKKDSDLMLQDTIEAMVGTLSKSVSDIVNAAPADRDELLAKSMGEFKDALLSTTAETLQKAAPAGEEPLYKGLGCVGRVANLLGTVAGQVKCIKDGKSWASDTDVDPASDDVADLLDHMVAVGELALRAAVNEHVEIPDDGEDMDDSMHYIAVPMMAGGETVVKTALPEDLAKFATDPDDIAVGVVEAGSAMLLGAGVPQAALEKALSPEGLAKAFPPKKDAKPSNMMPKGGKPAAQDDGSMDDGSGDAGQDPTQSDENPYPDAGSGDDGTGGDDPLSVLGQLLAASMIQLNHIQELVEGGGAYSGAPQDPVAPQPAPGMTKRAPEAAGIDEATLEKIVSDRVENSLAAIRPQIERFLAQPAAGKAVVGPAADGRLMKAADTGGVPMSGPTDEELSKLSDDQKFQILAKAAYRKPIPLIGR